MRRLAVLLFFISFILSPTFTLFGQEVKHTFTAQGGVIDDASHTHLQRHGGLWHSEVEGVPIEAGTTLRGKIRGLYWREKGYDRKELDVREFWLEHQEKSWRVDFGLSEYLSFSETFGLNPLDVVNAQNFNDFIYEEGPFRSIPQWLTRGSYYFPHLTAEVFLSPAPATLIYPKANGPADPLNRTGANSLQRISPKTIEPFSEIEFGGRLSYLFPQGGNLNALFYRHHNRHPAYKLKIENGPQMEEVQKEVNSLGTSFSKEVSEWILLGDALLTLKDPVNSSTLEYKEKDHLQLILGANTTSISTLTMVGFQYHYDSALNRSWASAKVSSNWGEKELWETTLTLFEGLDNSDFWPKIEINYNDFPWKWENSFNLWSGKSRTGILWPYHQQSLLLSRLSYQF